MDMIIYVNQYVHINSANMYADRIIYHIFTKVAYIQLQVLLWII